MNEMQLRATEGSPKNGLWRAWFGVMVVVLVVPMFIVTLLWMDRPGPTPVAEWIGGTVGILLWTLVIPGYVAAWTHFRRPLPVLVTFIIVYLLIAFSWQAAKQMNGKAAALSFKPSLAPSGYQRADPGVVVDPYRPPTSAPAVAAEQAWNQAATIFERSHPDTHYQHNAALVQEMLEPMGDSGLSNEVMLTRAYAAAKVDPRWSTRP